jgi:carbon-monoxide dehydrogenase large subunit
MPYKTAFGNTYDSGDFPAVFEKAVELADYDGFKERRRASKKAGKLRGIGMGCYLEIAGAFPEEQASISFPGTGRINIGIGATPQGQGHLTVFRHVAADRLGIAEDAITIVHGDSQRDVPGFGAVASRSAMYIGGAIVRTIEAMLEKGRDVASLLMQAGEAEVEYRDGKFVIGNERSISLFEVAERAPELMRQGVIKETLDTVGTVKAPSSFPNGCHVAEVEIDPETGAVSVERYTAIDDCGRLLDPVIVEGQMHGGIAQGLGQALSEATVYDPHSGQLLSGSFMDYAVPRAEMMPALTTAHIEVPCRTNPLGVKGTGEAGTTAAPPTLMNAVIDALPAGARHIDMPATAEKIFRALRAAASLKADEVGAVG